MHVMIRRQLAAQACVDRFFGKPYEPGSRDCAKMAGHLFHKLGVKVPFLKGKRWSSERGGIRMLKSLGFDSLPQAVDSLGLVRIAPAMALPADLIALPTDHPLGALAVPVGNGRALAYIDGEASAAIIHPTEFLCAWRTL